MKFSSIAMCLWMFCCAQLVQAEQVHQSKHHAFTVTEIASGLEFPWGLAFLPNGDMLVTERAGRLRLVSNGKLVDQPINGLPKNIYVSRQGGLLDVALHPDFASNQLVYLSYAGRGEGGAGTEVARARLEGNTLANLEVIFKAQPKTRGRELGSVPDCSQIQKDSTRTVDTTAGSIRGTNQP